MWRPIVTGLFAGDGQACDLLGGLSTATVHAAKDPWHREMVGYVGGKCSPTHPEYLWVRRGNRLALNLVDAPDARYFSTAIFVKALAFIDEYREAEKTVLVHCNQGQSRAPSIALLYLSTRVKRWSAYQEGREWFTQYLYRAYKPGRGIAAHLEQYWSFYHDRPQREKEEGLP